MFVSALALKAMCHTDVEAPMVTNWFPYFLPTTLFFSSPIVLLFITYNNLHCFEPKN